MATLADLASQIRSKNAGPMQLTIDVFFDDEEAYRRVKEAAVLTEETIAARYDIPTSDVLGVFTLDRITAIKISLARPVPAGSVEDTDMYGAQQHGPLVELEV